MTIDDQNKPTRYTPEEAEAELRERIKVIAIGFDDKQRESAARQELSNIIDDAVTSRADDSTTQRRRGIRP